MFLQLEINNVTNNRSIWQLSTSASKPGDMRLKAKLFPPQSIHKIIKNLTAILFFFNPCENTFIEKRENVHSWNLDYLLY